MISRRILAWLVGVAGALPVAIAISLGVARLLAAMQDDSAARALDRIALGLGIVWAVDLICLVMIQGINSLGPPDSP